MMKNRTIWDNLLINTSRRASMTRDLHYIKTMDGYPCIGIKGNIEDLNKIDKLRFEKLSMKGDKKNIYLIYSDIENIKIFEYICKDIIQSLESNKSEALIKILIKRILEWKSIFETSNTKAMSEQLQMGLLTELLFLKKHIVNYNDASLSINSWMGPERSKQDFIFAENAVEVKSYKSSSEKSVKISSIEQLYYPNGKLQLACYGLSNSDKGKSVRDIFKEVEELIDSNQSEVKDIFRMKVLKYGFFYYQEDEEPLKKFIVDTEEIYNVDESFPKIIPTDVMDGIERLTYKVNLMNIKKINNFALEKK